MSKAVQPDSEERPIAEVTVGSVTVPIYYAPVTIKVVSPPKEANGQPSEEFKQYDSYAIVYYEGSLRVQRRRNTLDKARAHAKEVATD